MKRDLKNKNKLTSMLKKHKVILLTTSTVLASVPIATTVGITINSNKTVGILDKYNFASNYSTGEIIFNGKKFKSYGEVIDYVNKNTKEVKTEDTNSKWSVQINGKTKYFNSPEELRKELLSSYNIKEISVRTDTDLSKYVDQKTGAFVNNEFWSHVDTNIDSKGTTIYKGLDDTIYTELEKAYNSYFITKSGFYFNGVYFDSKESLRSYLTTSYFPNLNQLKNTIILKSPNGNSYPIDLSRPDAVSSIDQFITANAEVSLDYQNNDKNYVINKNNVNELSKMVNTSDLSYNHVQSNQGQSRYIIDNADANNLIGPYFYDGVLDVGSFKNKNMWRKVTGVSKAVYIESKVDSTIGTFFTSILNDDNNLNKAESEAGKTNTLLFRTLLPSKVDPTISNDQWFLERLTQLAPSLSAAVIQANDSMMTGNKYNSFFKIPVLYSFLMQRAISWNLGNEVISLINNYFVDVCNFIQDVLEFGTLNNDQILKNKNGNKIFNVVDFFGIGNPEYDLNTSTEYFMDKLKTEYPNIVLFASTYLAAENNVTLAAGMIPYSSQDDNYLVESGVFKDTTELNNARILMEPVYKMFSSLNYQDMLKVYVTNSQDLAIKQISALPETQWAEQIKTINTKNSNISLDKIIAGIGAKNNEYIQLANSVLKLEIRTYLQSKGLVNGGYLSKLYDKNPRMDRLGTFLNFVAKEQEKDPNVNVYRIYLAFLLEKKSDRLIFNNDIVANPSLFAQRLVYLIGITFGSSVLVSGSLQKIYSGHDRLNTPIDAPILTLYKTSEYSVGGDFDSSRPSTPGGSIPPTPPPSIDGDFDQGKYVTEIDLEWAYLTGELDFCEPENIDKDLFTPSIREDSTIDTSRKITLIDLADTIDISSPDFSDDLLAGIKRYNELAEIEIQEQLGARLPNPFDEMNANLANSFDYVDELGDQIRDNGNSTIPGKNPNKVAKFDKHSKSWWSGTKVKFHMFADAFQSAASKFLNVATEIFGGIFAALEIGFFIFDLLKQENIQEFYQYVTADGTSFYWDGGLTVTKYFGLQVNTIHDIKEMQLVDPVQITLPQIEEFYYYDGIKYYDINEMKKAILNSYLNGSTLPQNSKFKKYFALSTETTAEKAQSIEELKNNVIKSLNIVAQPDGSFDITNLNTNSEYIENASKSFNSGYIIGSSDNNVSIINNIVSNLRRTYLVNKPEVVNNIATGNLNTNFKFPGKYWDGSKIIENPIDPNVLVDNSANDLNNAIIGNQFIGQGDFAIANSIEAENQALNNLYTTFKASFNIDSKSILKDAYRFNKYSEISGDITSQKIYQVTNNKGITTYYYDISSLTKDLLVKNNFNKDTSNNKTVYEFNNIRFNNEIELLNYVELNSRKLI